jgi:hypothetical protein
LKVLIFQSATDIEYIVPVCGFSNIEDLKTLSSIGKAFIILSNFKERNTKLFIDASKILAKEGEEISISVGLINYEDKELQKMKKVVSEFHSAVIYELENEDDIEKIVAPTVSKNFSFLK